MADDTPPVDTIHADTIHADTIHGGPAHPAIPGLARAHRAGRISRREFLAIATALGLTAAAARMLAGLPAMAQTAPPAPTPGGRIRIAMSVMPIADPRLFDWPQKGNLARGLLETLVRYTTDSTLEPWLLRAWETNADATEHILYLRPGVIWTNGDAFTSADVMANFARWSEAHVPGNSMAARIASLIETKRTETRRILHLRGDDEVEDEVEVAITGLVPGAVEVVDELTLRLRPSVPDITLVPGLCDYPALITHRGFDAAGADITAAPVGTGPWMLERVRPGDRATLIRREDAAGWWGAALHGPVPLDAIEFIDRGTDQGSEVSAFRDGEIDANYESIASYVAAFDALDLVRVEANTANTVCVRMNLTKAPFHDQAVRVAVQRAVDNAVVLELGYQDAGIIAQNHHVGPMHPEYAALDPIPADPAAALAMLTDAGAQETNFELISSDADVPRNTCDAVAAQMRDAGMRVDRTILPGARFWQEWRDFPFSATEWIMRPLGVQTYVLAYRSRAPWNETGFADPRFDTLLDAALALPDPDARRPLMAEMETILRDSGVLIQAYWRTTFRHMTARVHGLAMHPTFELHLERTWLDPT